MSKDNTHLMMFLNTLKNYDMKKSSQHNVNWKKAGYRMVHTV